MKYDFTTIIDRAGKDATAFDGIGKTVWGFEPDKAKPGFDEIPMWVADMNFATCPAVVQAMEQRLKHPLFGYFLPSDAYYQRIIDWQTTRHDWPELTRDMIGYENGVHGGITSTIQVLTEPGDAVLVHSPTYPGFIGDLSNTGRHVVFSPLRKEQGIWRMDFADMEEKIKKHHVHLAIFCSPQNPTGRVWERWEIEQAMALFKKYDVWVISDEIWSDIILNGHKHIPTQSVSEDAKMRTVALYAPSKTFNLAGLVGSYHIIYNSWLRDRCDKEGSLSHYNAMNVMSMHALLGAYRPEGYEWVEELRQVITGNVDFACDYIAKHFNGVDVSRPQGTYMLFLDCGEWLTAHGKTMDELLAAGWDVGVIWQDGRAFHGQTHIRMNLALPLSRVQEAFRRLDTYVFNA